MYIDVHKAIRRLAPAPKAKYRKESTENGKSDDNTVVAESEDGDAHKFQHSRVDLLGTHPGDTQVLSSSPKATTFMMRRRSNGADGLLVKTAVPVRANIEEMRQHLKRLGPSNPATNPKETRSTTVKIKSGLTSVPSHARTASVTGVTEEHEGDENTPLLRSLSLGKDGIQALRQSYGSTPIPDTSQPASPTGAVQNPLVTLEPIGDPSELIDHATQTSAKASQVDLSLAITSRPSSSEGSARGSGSNSIPTPRRHYVRSGSITENVVESRGVRKVVLETMGSQDEDVAGGMLGSLATSPAVQKSQSRSSLGRIFTETAPVPEEDEAKARGEALSPGTETEALLSPVEEGQSSQQDQEGGEGSNNKTGKKKNRRKKRRGGGS